MADPKLLLKKAAYFAQEKYPEKGKFGNITVCICYPGKQTWDGYIVRARNYDDNELTWQEYKNHATEKSLAQKRMEQRKKEQKIIDKRKQQEELARHEKKRQEMLVKKAKEEAKAMFLKKHGVKEQPSPDALAANPFVYEGKTIGLKAEFGEMLTATKAVLDAGRRDYVVVSDIPRGTFIKSGVSVLLVAKVVGKTDLQLPIFGTVSVPHLKFVGVFFDKN